MRRLRPDIAGRSAPPWRENRHVTERDTDRHLSNVAAGRLDLAAAPMISAWGRRPAMAEA